MTSSGERALEQLLGAMAPVLHAERLVIISTQEDIPLRRVGDLLGVFHEGEGTTLVLPVDRVVQMGFLHEPVWRRITLNIHSDLQAVGFLAALLPELARAGISVNVFSAYYHDHLLVPEERAEEAMTLLEALQRRSQ